MACLGAPRGGQKSSVTMRDPGEAEARPASGIRDLSRLYRWRMLPDASRASEHRQKNAGHKQGNMATASEYEYDVVDVASDGNCFFNALFLAAKNAGCLEKMSGSFHTSSSETCRSTILSHLSFFVQCARIAILPVIEPELIKMYLNLSTQTSQDLAAIMHSLPVWIADAMRNPTMTKEKFLSAAFANILTPNTWVGQVEVEAVTAWLNKSGVNLVVLTAGRTKSYTGNKITMVKPLQFTDCYDDPILYLYNDNQVHYKFISKKIYNTTCSTSGTRGGGMKKRASKKAAPTASKKAAPVASKKAAPVASKKAAPPASKKAAPPASKKALRRHPVSPRKSKNP